MIPALVAAWLLLRPQGASAVIDAQAWLEGHGDLSRGLRNVLSPVLRRVWEEGYKAGAQAAREASGFAGQLPAQLLEDLIKTYGAQWLGQIIRTRMERIAAILAEGGSADVIEKKIMAMLADEADAQMIVQTELTRAINAGAADVYRQAGIDQVRWMTEHDSRVCPACDGNEAAGARTYGSPFPSGVVMPPDHPRCRCALLPA